MQLTALFFVIQSQVCPFLIDPSSQATEWLKTHLKESRLEVINQQVNLKGANATCQLISKAVI